MMSLQSALVVTFGALVCAAAGASPATYEVKQLTLETAQKAAQAALNHCRKQGAQVAVAVVDRAGNTQVMLRDRFAGAHTPEAATNKAWTAVSFKTNTTELARETEPGRPHSGVRHWTRVVVVGGGMTIQAGGQLLGGIGISGAPGAMDDDCAKAGIKAISDEIEF